MLIHTNANLFQVHAAAAAAGVSLVKEEQSGSRTHSTKYNVQISGHSGRRTNSGWGGAGDHEAATWDEWGVFIANLYRVDKSALIGRYGDVQSFHAATDDRFRSCSMPNDTHKTHRWQWDQSTGRQCCTQCSASRS